MTATNTHAGGPCAEQPGALLPAPAWSCAHTSAVLKPQKNLARTAPPCPPPPGVRRGTAARALERSARTCRDVCFPEGLGAGSGKLGAGGEHRCGPRGLVFRLAWDTVGQCVWPGLASAPSPWPNSPRWCPRLRRWRSGSFPAPCRPRGICNLSIRLSAEVSKGRTWLYRNHAQWRGARLLVSDHSSSNPKSSAVPYN